MKKRNLAVLLTMGMAFSMLAGCGSSSQTDSASDTTSGSAAESAAETEAESASDEEAAGEKKTLTVWVRESTAEAAKSAAEKYNQIQDAVNVEVVVQVSSSVAEQFTLALAAGEAPDVISLDCTKVPYFAANGAFTDISDRYEALEYKDQFSEGMMKSGQVDGKTYAVPFSPDVSVLLYNKDHYTEAGLDPEDPPETWDELIEYSQKLTNGDRYGYVYAGGHNSAYLFTFMPYVWNNGGEFLSEDGKQCLLNEEKAIEAVQLLSDMINVYKVTPPSTISYSWGEAQDAFLTGQASQIVLGSAAIYNFVNGTADMNWGACLIPKGPSGSGYASFSGGDSIGITSQCEDVEEAWKFIEYALSEDVQVEELAKGGCLPARKDFFDNEYFDATPQYEVLKEALEVSHTPYSLKYDEMYTPILDNMQRCLNQEVTPEEAVNTITEQINALLAE